MTLPELAAALAGARRGPLLVACDFDGVLAPIAPSPGLARPDPDAVRALGALACTPGVHAAIISGRSRAHLLRLASPPPAVTVIGSHGVEFENHPAALSPPERSLLEQIGLWCERLAAGVPGAIIEHKPFGVAVHERLAGDSAAGELRRRLLDGPACLPGVFTCDGNRVLELCVRPPGKGAALARLRHGVGAHAVVYIGDDRTDEDAFAVMHPPDVSIRVGPGPTLARHVLPDQGRVAGVLEFLATPARSSRFPA